MRIFIERFILGIFSPLVVMLAANSMGFSWILRIICIIAIVIVAGIAAYFAGWDEWRWERLRGLWWLWAIFGLSGGVAFALWLIPLIAGAPASDDEARLRTLQSQLKEARQERDQATQNLVPLQSQLTTATTQNTTLQSKLETAQRQRDAAQQKLAAAEGQLAAPHTDVAKISELESQLSAERREVESAKQAEKAARNMPPSVGPIYALNAFSAAEGLFQDLLSSNTSILVTATPGNDYAKFVLNNTLSVGARKLPPGKSLLLYQPNNTSDLDVPHPTSHYNGIVIHGTGLSSNALNDLKNVLRARCFIEPHTTSTVPGELKKYYKRDNIIWIEIGSGSPWLSSGSCPD